MAKSFWAANKTWLIPVLIVLGLTFIVIMWFVSAYNSLIITRENVDTQWANVETTYQRRLDLIPNLVETVAAFAEQEESVFTQVTAARAKVGQIKLSTDDLSDPARLRAFATAQQELGGALSKLLAVAERYPDLKSGENFLALQDQLEGTENRISVARRDFNTAVRSYNVKVQRIPTALVANMFGFDKREFFEADEGAEAAPSINREDFA
ncbi:MAG: LemA family protein [Candidatus Woesearchaeota archaeon]|nr:LemA family protein [Candidatus Woesearchaeota archaeon]